MRKPFTIPVLRAAAAVLVLFLAVPALAAGPVRADSLASPDRNANEEIAELREQIASDPGNSVRLIRLGFLLLDKNATPEAETCFDRALALNPRSGEAKTGKGIVLARKGNLLEAARTLRDALPLNPNPVRAHYELGRIYEQQGDPDKALAEYKTGILKHEQGR